MDEAHRPQFHFTCRAGWLCDVNGPIFHAGEYHLFYEYNPAAPTWTYTNMHWGHAVSPDLLHWRELPPMLAHDRHGPVNSGSVAVDWHNTCGLAAGGGPVLVALYTEGRYLLPANRPAAQSLAYSTDRGRTWIRFAGNPVLGATTHFARAPKVMPDIAGLIAPRHFLAVAGRDDPIFPVAHTKAAFEQLARIYPAASVPDRCELYVGDGGHRYYKERVWSFIAEGFGAI